MKTEQSNTFKILLLAGVVLSMGIMFAGGFFFRGLMISGDTRNKPTPSVQISGIKPSSPPYATNKTPYYDDSLILVAKAAPHEAIVISASRSKVLNVPAQTTRMSYFDGKSWQRQVAYGSGPAAAASLHIGIDDIIKSWDITIDPSRVLRQSAKGELKMKDITISFETGTLENEMGIRSLPGYTKFMSVGNGTFTVNGSSQEAYVLYERIYSEDDKEIQFYDTPLGVTTYWLAFWDEDGNFYHLDKSEVLKPTKIYQTHQFGILRTPDAAVVKTFSVTGTRDITNSAPSRYTFQFNSPINTTIDVTSVSSLNKAANPGSVWLMNSVIGTVVTAGVTHQGIGLVEFVQD